MSGGRYRGEEEKKDDTGAEENKGTKRMRRCSATPLSWIGHSRPRARHEKNIMPLVHLGRQKVLRPLEFKKKPRYEGQKRISLCIIDIKLHVSARTHACSKIEIADKRTTSGRPTSPLSSTASRARKLLPSSAASRSSSRDVV